MDIDTLIAIGLGILIIVSVLIYYSKAGLLWKMAALPALLFLAFKALGFYQDQLGRPIYHKPDGDFLYIMHVENAQRLELVAHDGISERLYIFPYNKEDADELDRADTGTKQGQYMIGHWETNPNDSKGKLEFWPMPEVSKS